MRRVPLSLGWPAALSLVLVVATTGVRAQSEPTDMGPPPKFKLGEPFTLPAGGEGLDGFFWQGASCATNPETGLEVCLTRSFLNIMGCGDWLDLRFELRQTDSVDGIAFRLGDESCVAIPEIPPEGLEVTRSGYSFTLLPPSEGAEALMDNPRARFRVVVARVTEGL